MTYQVLKNWLFSAIRLEIKDFTAKLNLVECPLPNTALPYTSPDAAVCCLALEATSFDGYAKSF
ncbi:hypothetical protein GNF10_32040 [Nostoc sp. UCD121]|uniref:hypothetical protein n=1 Tax=unclassified Nostoc TaxID=2593658 RepID=UPI0016280FEE|nr:MULTISPECIES: hypothetical protein [unclassified Nostoc]MBC1298236.1 hypothetical protein [Nostoc sp. UCD122]MBC1221635.1 hypothetical protein [Nostoc sp. UCD120]MBC1279692.1 hypothetical protein [Nostoc sp. UCD121]MBC1280448.1 hypothetical protein [Nostoc sp. UCD121]MBC1299597.1 hypothetical protein [Nostoc sp. UCD122]